MKEIYVPLRFMCHTQYLLLEIPGYKTSFDNKIAIV